MSSKGMISYLFILLLISGGFLPAQQIKFDHISEEDGLSHSWVKTLYRDSFGFMWFGSGNSGMNKYDGYNFTIYKNQPKNKYTISNNTINVILEDQKKNLWVGTQLGLNRYDRELDRFVSEDGFNNVYIEGIYELPDGRLIITSLSEIITYNPETKFIKTVNLREKGLKKDITAKGLFYWQNTFWLATREGLFIIDTTNYSLSHVNLKSSANDNNTDFRSVYTDSKNRVWLGTENHGLFCLLSTGKDPFNPEVKHFIHDPKRAKSIGKGVIVDIAEDESGYLWIGMDSNGMNRLNLAQMNEKHPVFEHYHHDPTNSSSLSSDAIYDIFKDSEGTVWIGTFNGGVSFYNKLLHKFSHIKQEQNSENSLNGNNVNVIYEEDNYLWVGTQKGLNNHDKRNKTWHLYENNENDKTSIGSNAVWVIFRDSRKNLWVGTWGGGLNLFNESRKTFTRFLHNSKNEKSISNNNIFGISEDKDGNLWIATMGGGLNKYDYKTNTFKRYISIPNDSTSLLNNWVKAVLESSHGESWVISGGGADLFDKKTEVFTHFTHDTANEKSLSSSHIVSIFEDSRGNIWFGTENGLNAYNHENDGFICYNEEDGLPDNVIRGILEDDHGNLWISSNKGLTKFFNAVDLPGHPVFRNYTMDDGLQGESFNSRTCFKGKDGRLYFGGNNGFNVFHPDSIKENPHIPEIVFTDLFIFNKEVKINQEDSPLSKHINEINTLTLSYKHSVIGIQYAGLNYLAPEKCNYAYRMEGFDEDWNYVGGKKEANYTNLDPGEYIFRVKASNNDGVWNEEGASVKIIITPPFWKTWWFRTIVILIIVGSIYIIYKIRIRSLEAHRRELEQKVEERTLQLSEKAHDLEMAKNEMDNILNNVEEGFFIIDDQYKISSQYSAILETILCTAGLARIDFIEFLKNKIPEEEILNTKSYLDLLLKKDLDETTIADLNPLIDLKFVFNDSENKDKKYLNFKFKRIGKKTDNHTELVVTVRDVTRQVQLAMRLKEEEERREKLLQLMLSILDVEPQMLTDFSESANRELEFLDTIINQSEVVDYDNFLEKVHRSVHLIKGNAKLLNIDYFATQAHQFEDIVSEFQKRKEKITAKDIDTLRKRLKEMQTGMDEMERIIEKIGKVLANKGKAKKSDAKLMLQSLENLINSFSSDLGKKIKFDYKNFKSRMIPARYNLLVKEILIQLVRNSISHGIEHPNVRLKLNKPQQGRIEISTFKKDGTIGFRLRDDGSGIKIEKLREMALKTGKWTAEEINGWTDQQVADLIFVSGITTSERVDMVAGRGVGLDGVKHRLREHKGEIYVHFDRNKFCEFEVLLPAAA
ncbi:MAG: Hpt domain-containing protein [Calditrichaceae bacterium]|nr:Hpt domain-containing protein [Calditrichaceae bacterium]MBN2710149.1 Hpt domain-containing protein [Calditrichaceae bacterium]